MDEVRQVLLIHRADFKWSPVYDNPGRSVARCGQHAREWDRSVPGAAGPLHARVWHVLDGELDTAQLVGPPAFQMLDGVQYELVEYLRPAFRERQFGGRERSTRATSMSVAAGSHGEQA